MKRRSTDTQRADGSGDAATSWLYGEPFDAPRPLLNRRQFVGGCLALLGTSLLTGLYTWQVEPHWLDVVRHDMPIRNLPVSLDGATLLHLSDIHLGPQVSDSFILDSFSRLSLLEPDITVITGDFTSYHADVLDNVGRVYADLPLGRIATVGVLGNHDYGLRWSDYAAADALSGVLHGLGVTVLRNEILDIEGLQIVGMDELWADSFEPEVALASVDSEGPVVALVHNPDCVDLDGWDGFQGWILAGHTHGGQCKPPFLPPPLLPVENRDYVAGEVDLGAGRMMYISRGLGHAMQVRFNARPEATVFVLRAM